MGIPPTNQLIEWIETIQRECVNLTTWEESFIESMQDIVARYGDETEFTRAQATQIERIYAERTP